MVFAYLVLVEFVTRWFYRHFGGPMMLDDRQAEPRA